MSRWQEYDWDMMVRRKAPTPLVAAALLLGLWVATADNGSINAVRCEADHQALLASFEAARQQVIGQLNAQIETAAEPERVTALIQLREQAWDDEETQRGRAQLVFRECLKAVQRSG